MDFMGISYLAVVVAAIVAFAFGAVYYMALAKPWMAAAGLTEEQKPEPSIFVITFACELVMAYFLAGLMGHLGTVTLSAGLISGFFVWIGFIAPTMIINQRYTFKPWSLSLIDGAHWLGVALIMGAVIGIFGA